MERFYVTKPTLEISQANLLKCDRTPDHFRILTKLFPALKAWLIIPMNFLTLLNFRKEMTKQVKKIGVFSFIIINWLGIVIEIFQWHTLFDFKKLYLTSPSTSTFVIIIRNNWNLKFFAKTFTSFPLINSSSFIKPAWRSFPRGQRYKRKQKYEKDFYVWQLFL